MYQPTVLLTVTLRSATIHENIFIDVGSAMSSVALEKYTRVSTSKPTVNMWCAHTKYPTTPIAIMAYTIPKLLNSEKIALRCRL